MKQLSEVSELIKDLWWCSEIDESWKLEIYDDLEQIKLDNAKTVDVDKFFSKATQSKLWYGEEENKEVEQYRALVQWLKTNLTDLTVYQIGQITIDIYVVGQLGVWQRLTHFTAISLLKLKNSLSKNKTYNVIIGFSGILHF